MPMRYGSGTILAWWVVSERRASERGFPLPWRTSARDFPTRPRRSTNTWRADRSVRPIMPSRRGSRARLPCAAWLRWVESAPIPPARHCGTIGRTPSPSFAEGWRTWYWGDKELERNNRPRIDLFADTDRSGNDTAGGTPSRTIRAQKINPWQQFLIDHPWQQFLIDHPWPIFPFKVAGYFLMKPKTP